MPSTSQAWDKYCRIFTSPVSNQVVLCAKRSTRRTVFADNGQYDNRSGHPGMLPINSDAVTGVVYYLLLTSNMIKKEIYPDQYYNLGDCWQDAHLKRPSLIDLTVIDKSREVENKVGGLPPQVFKNVIRDLKAYQEHYPCENYKEMQKSFKLISLGIT